MFCLIGMQVRAINRPGSQLLGANGRDDGPIVSFCPYTFYRDVFVASSNYINFTSDESLSACFL